MYCEKQQFCNVGCVFNVDFWHKITFVYNFVAPLNLNQKQTSGILSVVAVMVVQGCSVKKVFLEISQTKRVFLWILQNFQEHIFS